MTIENVVSTTQSHFLFVNQRLFKVLLGVSLMLYSGCKAIHDVEVAKQDIKKAVTVWHQDIEPRLKELERVVVAVETDFKKDRKEAKAIWDKDIEPRLSRLEQIISTVESGLKTELRKASTLWQKDIKPRLVRLEKLVAAVESKVANELRHALVVWHKDIESHLLRLDHVAGTAKADIEHFTQHYHGLKVDLRSIKVRAGNDLKNNPAVPHVNSLIGHVEDLEKQHNDGITKSVIPNVRAKIENDVSEALKKF